ncbi:uncharacterized protein TRUGW13939_01744 [Talaromyces rugulosus]|uniref:FAD-binding domain-containing protein n=1 Tax=Talaromyces rugulosus TaxID=121627 RepID=A0A7H8QL97_TALRU|nr:uncharacterized protein TRUGW13939_01744 [Talaromyces rugulosus]QKX54656.1 hypothetical protein TRUGW13939_01744 [Talaromyces rugulosus]
MALKIAIVGAGPAGCILARLLLYQIQPEQLRKDKTVEKSARSIDITIFESEHSVDFRSQGGSLDLHDHTGILALRKAGLNEEFLAHARYDGEAMSWTDKSLRAYLKLSGNTGRPEIDRSDLRKILTESLPEDIVQWNKKLVGVRKKPASGNENIHGADQWELEFMDGTTASGYDLIVGADGAWSKVRSSVLSDEKPFHSGVGGYCLVIPNVKETAPDMYQLVNRGTYFTFDGGDKPHSGRALIGQQLSNGNMTVSLWMACPENWQETVEYDINDGAAIKQFMIEKKYKDWHPRLLEAVRHADENNVVARSLYMLPVGFTWPHQQGITLLGDAAHLMTPFAGEGVNLAFEDAIHLCDAIKETLAEKNGSSVEKTLDNNVIAFEKNMNQRATITQSHTFEQMVDWYFTPGSPGNNIERVILRNLKFKSQGSSLLLYNLTYPFTAAMIYTGYFIYKRFLLW